MKIAFYGSSLLSSYWNGAATYYRGVLAALAQRGYAITFYEPDAFERQQHRDIDPPDWVRSVVWPATDEGLRSVLAEARARHLHELVDVDPLAAAMRPQRQAEGGRALALAVAGVDQHQPAALAAGDDAFAVDGRLFDFHVVLRKRETVTPTPLAGNEVVDD